MKCNSVWRFGSRKFRRFNPYKDSIGSDPVYKFRWGFDSDSIGIRLQFDWDYDRNLLSIGFQ